MSQPALGVLGDPAPARDAARAILSESRFHAPGVPRPLHGALVAIGNVLQAPFRALGSLVDRVAVGFPGGVTGVWIAVALALLGFAWVFALRRSRQGLAGDSLPGALGSPERSGDLERAASLAERDGRLEDAVRLRFRAGLARLSERRRITSARTTPTVEISGALRSPHFDLLATRFDEIAYGSSAAVLADVEAARSEWARVLSGDGGQT